MRFTRIAALFLTVALPCLVYGQRVKKPVIKPVVPAIQPRPSASPVPPMTDLQMFYYQAALDSYARAKTLRKLYDSEDYDKVDCYGANFDNDNYRRAMADEFERNRYRARIRAKIEDEVKKVDFNQKFSSISYQTLGEYSFESHSFPVGSRAGVNGDQFASSLPMSEGDANIFVKSRARESGNINRTVKVRTIYSFVNDAVDGSRASTACLSYAFQYFVYSVEVFADEGMTRKLGDIRRINSLPKTGEEWSLASMAAQKPTKEIGNYEYMSEHIYYSSRERGVGRLILTDVGYSLLDGNHAISTDHRTKIDCDFYNRAKGRISRGKYSFKISFDPAEWFLVNAPCTNTIPFETQQERDRFFADLTRALREWKTKYAGFQFAALDLSIEGETSLYRFPPDGCVVVKVYAAPLFFYPKGGEIIITPPPPSKAWRDKPDVKTQPPSDLKTGEYKICAADRDAWGIEVRN